uniref:Uncharacterized protein n=1 Tax=Ciona intestinalis TaxID=7719 RepID=F6QXS4_CIOIN
MVKSDISYVVRCSAIIDQTSILGPELFCLYIVEPKLRFLPYSNRIP